MACGIYISVPFCQSKCSYCNFASGVFARNRMEQYCIRVCDDIRKYRVRAQQWGAQWDDEVDTIYLGGGTPSLLPPDLFEQLFTTVRSEFRVAPNSEITVECAPGTLSPAMRDMFIRCGVNRISLGVQSFVDKEARAVARMHGRDEVLRDLESLRACGIDNINLDLIAGMPFQDMTSWEYSVQEALHTSVPHISVYMLEVDEDSRLGRELQAGGARYHAHHVPSTDRMADMYEYAIQILERSGIKQYEISNFAQEGRESLHNMKYWTRAPYLGFGLDAHSFLYSKTNGSTDGLRFSTQDDLEQFIAGENYSCIPVSRQQAIEEELFLGLRMNRGIDISDLQENTVLPPEIMESIHRFKTDRLLESSSGRLKLTTQGRLLSNEVFVSFLNGNNAK